MGESYWKHYKATLKLGLPIVVGQLGIIVLGFADTVMIGRYDTESLASVSFVNNVFNLVVISLLGFSYGITPLVGALFARGEKEEAGRVMRSALVTNLLFGVALTAVMGVLFFFLDRFGQPEELLPTMRPYYLTILVSMVFVALMNAMRQFTDSLTRTSTAMWILLFGNAFNIVFNYLLIYGKLGFPELGALGAGISTMSARVAMVAVYAAVLLRGRSYAAYRRGFFGGRARRKELARVTKVSLPVSLQMAMETATFSFSAVMVGWIGAVELASFQVLMTMGTLGFMFYYSVGAAVAIRVSGYSGKGDRAGVRRSAWSGYHILLVMAFLASFVFYRYSGTMIGVFTDDARVAAVSAALVVPLIVYQFGDATQICFANALRGTSEVVSMMWIALVSYVLAGIPCAYLMGFPLGLGERGIFLSFSVALFLAAALFLWRFVRATRRGA